MKGMSVTGRVESWQDKGASRPDRELWDTQPTSRSGNVMAYRGRLPMVTFNTISRPARTTTILTISPGDVFSAR